MSKQNKKVKILVIEDDIPLSFFITKKLEQMGFVVDTVNDGGEGFNAAMSNEYVLLIVDVALPNMNGHQIVEKIKAEGLKVPVIVITNDYRLDTEIKAFKSGTTLFHKKPINFELFETQVKSILKYQLDSTPIQNKALYIEPTKHFVQKDGEPIELSNKEFKILMALITSNGSVLTRQKLLNQTFKGIRDLEEGSIDTMISRLRKKIGKYKDVEIIETVHGEGYRFNPTLL